jgi:hypothetical protein
MNYRDEFKVSFVNKPNYYIDTDKRTVKCYLTCDIKTPNALYGNQVLYNTRISASGYAKCDGKDLFDPEVGKKIALARAEEKIYFKALHMAKKAKKDAEVFINAFDKFEDKCYRVCAHNEDYIDQYCFASHPKFKGNTKKSTVNEHVHKYLSDKAKAQPRDEQGRFTACTDSQEIKVCDKNKDVTCKNLHGINDHSQGQGVIKIKINRI